MPRPKKSNKNVQISCNASSEHEALIEKLAKEREWSKALVGGKLLLRGIAAWQRDGLIDEPDAQYLLSKTA